MWDRFMIVVFAVFTAHAALALWFWHPWPALLRQVLAIGLILTLILLLVLPFGVETKFVWTFAAALLGFVELAFLLKRPSDASWIPSHARMASAVIMEDDITIKNFRAATYPEGKEVVEWVTRSVRPTEIEGAELVLQRFGALEAMAHAMVTFRLTSGEHIAVSVESRRSPPGNYNPLGGLFKAYQLIIIFSGERDVLWKRLGGVQRYPMVIYPIAGSKEQTQAFFKALVDRANSLHQRPEFYSLFRKNCLTLMVDAAPIVERQLGLFEYRHMLPGYADDLFLDLGVVAFDGELEAMREKFAVREEIRPPSEFPDAASWSRHIRQEP